MKNPTHVEFADAVGIPLSPGQKPFVKVAFDGTDPCALEGDEREIARQIFGDVDHVPPGARTVVGAVFGRDSGKDNLHALYQLHGGCFATPRTMATGERAYCLTIAPSLALARITLDRIRGKLEEHATLSKWIEVSVSDSITIRRPDGVRVAFDAVAASRGGSGTRGKTILRASLNEADFFLSAETGAVNAESVFTAVLPRADGVLVGSTPYLVGGLLHKLYEQNFGKPRIALVAHASTNVMRSDDQAVLAMIAREYIRDEANARQEFGAEWLARGSGNLFGAQLLESSLVDAADTALGEVSIGGDLALVKDASAFCAVRRNADGSMTLVDVLELRPKKGEPLSLGDVVRRADDFARKHGQRKILVDNHQIHAAREMAAIHGCSAWFEAASESPMDRERRFANVVDAFKAGKFKIPRAFASVANELGSLVQTPRAGGGFSVHAPRRGGSHCDTASALILACEALFSDLAHRAALRKIGERAIDGSLAGILSHARWGGAKLQPNTRGGGRRGDGGGWS